MILLIAVIFIAIFSAIEDKLQYAHGRSIFNRGGKDSSFSFWGRNSWTRKYKHGNPQLGPKFFGSTTFLVWLTDGWHLVKAMYLVTIFIAMVLPSAFTEGMAWYWMAAEAVVLFVVYGLIFELFYKFILHKR